MQLHSHKVPWYHHSALHEARVYFPHRTSRQVPPTGTRLLRPEPELLYFKYIKVLVPTCLLSTSFWPTNIWVYLVIMEGKLCPFPASLAPLLTAPSFLLPPVLPRARKFFPIRCHLSVTFKPFLKFNLLRKKHIYISIYMVLFTFLFTPYIMVVNI